MQSRDHAELAALVASQAAGFVRGDEPQRRHLEAYWVHSRCRLQRWHTALKGHGNLLRMSDRSIQAGWEAIGATIEEIFVSDMLTRVWAAVASGFDRRNGHGDVEPVVMNIFAAHAEATGRALNMLVVGEGSSAAEATRLNQLRRRVERWTDMLLGTTMLDTDADEFAFDRQRVGDFFEDFERKNEAERQMIWRLQVGALRNAFAHHKSHCANVDLNRKIAASVIACYRVDAFASSGLVGSLWLEKLDSTANQAQTWIDELFAM